MSETSESILGHEPTSEVKDEIRCKKLIIVNNNNEPRIEMSADFKGNGVIRMRNGDSKGGIFIGFDREHDAVINIVNNQEIVEVQIIGGDGGQITIADKNGDLARSLNPSDDEVYQPHI